MSHLTYTILTGDKDAAGSIKSWLNYSLVDSAGVLADAEAMIYQRLRVREMRASATLAFSIGDYTKALPTGFLDPRTLRDITNDTKLDLVDEEALEDMRTWTAGVIDAGDPSYYAIFDELIQLDVKATTAFSARMLYWKTPTALSTSNESNFMTDRYSHILRSMCLATGARFAKDDERFQSEQRLAFSMIDEASAMDELSRRGQDNPISD